MQDAGSRSKASSSPKSTAITPGLKSAVPPAPQSNRKTTMIRAGARMQPRKTSR